MEREERHNTDNHIIDIRRNDDAPSNLSTNEQPSGVNFLQSGDRHSTSSEALANQPSSDRLNSRNSFMRRGDSYGRRRRSPLNSGLWISFELVVTVGQIIASVVVLSISKDENPKAPLFTWIVGYALGCVATLPIFYWRFHNRNHGIEQDSIHLHQGSSQSNVGDPTPYTAVSVTPPSDEESNNTIETATANGQSQGTVSMRRSTCLPAATLHRRSTCLPAATLHRRSTAEAKMIINGLVDNFKMALDCFFAVWFVVGNVWIFGGHTSPSDAPNLYRLCIVFLTFSCIGYAMPFILCATICCCLPCIISVLGFREDLSQTRGASVEAINALPTYKFKPKSENVNDQDSSGDEGGILSAGTDKERFISGEDAVCCICLAKYAEGDGLRELPCIHVFHVECVDRWLKINASCPLCKTEVGESSSSSQLATESAG